MGGASAPTSFGKGIAKRIAVVHTGRMITQSICATCGTPVLRDEETLAEVHRDPTYDKCGIEGELGSLADRIEGKASPAKPTLRIVK